MRKCMWLLLVGVLVLALSAQSEESADSRVEILDFYAFDPLLGKQHEITEFNWPAQREAGALVRFETSGYSERKTVSIHFALTDRYGEVQYKDTQELMVFAGQHEWVMPHSVDISRLYSTDRYTIRTEIKLVGGNRLEDLLEIVVNGPKPPQVRFSDLRLEDPVSGDQLGSLKPRQLVMIRGTVEVTENTTPHLPKLVVYGLMSKDSLQVDNWDAMPYCDSYWDLAQLDKTNGKWAFAVEARMPAGFVENAVESQPLEVYLVVAFTTEAYTKEVIAGTVMASGTGLLIAKELGERLLQIERNWYWELESTH